MTRPRSRLVPKVRHPGTDRLHPHHGSVRDERFVIILDMGRVFSIAEMTEMRDMRHQRSACIEKDKPPPERGLVWLTGMRGLLPGGSHHW
ncbi:MAG: hypothetical protein GY807_00450 [Gammaproteobacteria bacterium]|nr:hypothetical protein [Gammaproteobacteria bacterium]